ncbi:MAG: SpoIIE family protein phosphatase [bacterium]|nr:MAG: SpoIIE family protein phosphatase [bacterium]
MMRWLEHRSISLRTKFIFLSAILVTVIVVTITYFFTIRELHNKRAGVEMQIQRIAENIATIQLLDRQDWAVYQNYISRLIDFNRDIVYIAIYDDRRTLRAHALNDDLIDIQYSQLSRRLEAEIIRRLDEGAVADESREDFRTQRVNIQIGDRILGSVHVGFSLIQINTEQRNSIYLIIGLATFFLFIFTGASVFISSRLTDPLERLSRAMTAVANGNLQQKIDIETSDEIGQLSENFNEMVEGLKERQIIENLAGELRGTFILRELALIIRERMGTVIGASTTRLYIRNKNNPTLYEEITALEKEKHLFPPIITSPELKEYIREKVTGFMIHDCPESILDILHHDLNLPNGWVIPLVVKEELLGMLFFVLPSHQQQFEAKKQQFVVMLANQATLALDNTLLYEIQQEQERFKRELEIAREVQMKLLPVQMPQFDDFHIDGFCRSAQEVGGDYFDFFSLDDNHLGIVIADVSGKGTSASFYMAEIKGMMLQLAPRVASPKQLLKEINRSLFSNVDRHLFVTMIYGILDREDCEFRFARAGHNSLLYVGANGSNRLITPSGIGLGLNRGDLFQDKISESNVKLSPGDMVVLYTDGITEAMNENLEEYGEDRFMRFFIDHRGAFSTYRKELIRTLEKYMGGQPQHDDLTMVIFQYDPG